MKNIETDILLVGGGIMSATLSVLLKQLDPALQIIMIERLDDVALESSDALNNAGTGHAGYCELNYTPIAADGDISIRRALEINAAFETSLQFWAHLVETGALPSAENFINRVPHLSLVFGDKNIDFLKRRHQLLSQHHLFADMQYSEDVAMLKAWMPLIMAERKAGEHLAATYVEHGTDVNFGSLTRHLVKHLKQQTGFSVQTNTQATKLKKIGGKWHVAVYDRLSRHSHTINAKFVFLGAGGGALPLLQKSGIPQSKGYGGFPVSGQWLICNNPAVVKQHRAKVYGKAAVGAPPMSVPHLDTRIIDGKPSLLFGPFAGFTTKFLKKGSSLDLAKSLKADNIKAMLGVGKNNIDLTKYLIKEARQTHTQRMETLREFLPQAQSDEWTLAEAGQRVQIIKHCEQNWGKLEFGTEIVAADDGSLAALLGASPGASVSVQAMLNVLEKCFPEQLEAGWASRLKKMIPAYGESLIDDASLLRDIRQRTLKTLNI
ncbi:MAG TPA: malate dehydrogenase (quinone) [Methylophilus sp.]|nr:malate dehydrogenase (quinone) [Methylophilus sp.]HQQ33993.1 malate dehydrogenase (quinone) [Methylophilus sp.]